MKNIKRENEINDYSLSTIHNILDANTKLLDNKKELEKQLLEKDKIINNAINIIKEYCIDDEFIVNLSKKEKAIIKVLNILEGKEDEEDEDIFSFI